MLHKKFRDVQNGDIFYEEKCPGIIWEVTRLTPSGVMGYFVDALCLVGGSKKNKEYNIAFFLDSDIVILNRQ